MMRRLLFNLQYLFGKPPWDTGVSPPELLDFLHNHPPGRALDLGCGTGTNAITMANRGWLVTGLDFSGRAIRIAQRKVHDEGLQVDLRQDDLTHPQDFEEPFDLVLDIGCFHSLADRDRARYAANLRRYVKPGGTFLLYTWLRPAEVKSIESPTEAATHRYFNEDFQIVSVEYGHDRHRTAGWFTMRRKT